VTLGPGASGGRGSKAISEGKEVSKNKSKKKDSLKERKLGAKRPNKRMAGSLTNASAKQTAKRKRHAHYVGTQGVYPTVEALEVELDEVDTGDEKGRE
jgi:hypothetical protein